MALPKIPHRLADLRSDPTRIQTLAGSLDVNNEAGGTNGDAGGIRIFSVNDGQTYVEYNSPLNATPYRWGWVTIADRAMSGFYLWCNKIASQVMSFVDDGSLLLGCNNPPATSSKPMVAIGAGQNIVNGNSAGTFFGIRDNSNSNADVEHHQDSSGNTVRRLFMNGKEYVAGDVVITDATKGVVLKSANGHFWRLTVGNTGTLSTTDLGTSLP